MYLTVRHNSMLVLSTPLYGLDRECENEVVAQTRMLGAYLALTRGGEATVIFEDEEDWYPRSWTYVVIRGEIREFRECENWEEEFFGPETFIPEPPTSQIRLASPRWENMGEMKRDFLPAAKKSHQKRTIRRIRRDARMLIQEQMAG